MVGSAASGAAAGPDVVGVVSIDGAVVVVVEVVVVDVVEVVEVVVVELVVVDVVEVVVVGSVGAGVVDVGGAGGADAATVLRLPTVRNTPAATAFRPNDGRNCRLRR